MLLCVHAADMDLPVLQRDCYNSGAGKCYGLATNDIEGRYLIATRDIEPGEMILQEFPSSLGPSYSTHPVCLGCYKPVDGSIVCENCSWPLCSKSCSSETSSKTTSNDHTRAECDILARAKPLTEEFNFDGSPEPLYDIISPLRILLQRDQRPDLAEVFFLLESHLDEWRQQPNWADQHGEVFSILTEKLGLEIAEDDLLRIFGIFYTNDFSVRVDGGVDEEGIPRDCPKIRLCYALVSMCSHDCTPNTWRNILGQESGFKHNLKARRLITKGERITINYIDIMLPNALRREHLMQGKKFECKCHRCSDPSEIGTFGNSILCQICGSNMLQDEAESDWKCQKAKDHTKPYLEVLDWFRQLERDTDELLNSVAKCDVKNCESFLASHRQKLHRYNMFMVRVKYSLCGMYGRTSGYAMQELKPADVMRKKLLCEELLEVLQKIDAGISVRRGMVMYELHLPLIMLAQLGLQSGSLSREKAKKEFKKGLSYLKKSLQHLQHEPDGTFEKNVYYGAKTSVAPLENFVSNAFS